jgi:hypothetical protein
MSERSRTLSGIAAIELAGSWATIIATALEPAKAGARGTEPVFAFRAAAAHPGLWLAIEPAWLIPHVHDPAALGGTEAAAASAESTFAFEWIAPHLAAP